MVCDVVILGKYELRLLVVRFTFERVVSICDNRGWLMCWEGLVLLLYYKCICVYSFIFHSFINLPTATVYLHNYQQYAILKPFSIFNKLIILFILNIQESVLRASENTQKLQVN